MTKQEIMQAVENLKGEQFTLYCGNDIDNAMTAIGAGSIFSEISLADFIEDELPAWVFNTDDEGLIYIAVAYKVIDGDIEKAVNDFRNGDIEEWQLEEVAQKTTIEVTNIKEI